MSGIDAPIQEAQAFLPISLGLLENYEIVCGREIPGHYTLRVRLRSRAILNFTVLVAGFLTVLPSTGEW